MPPQCQPIRTCSHVALCPVTQFLMLYNPEQHYTRIWTSDISPEMVTSMVDRVHTADLCWPSINCVTACVSCQTLQPLINSVLVYRPFL